MRTQSRHFTSKLADSVFAGDKPIAIVLGLDGITGLQAARVLARRDIPVIGIGFSKHAFLKTNVCRGVVVASITELTQALDELGSRCNQKAILFPCTDLSVLEVSRNRDILTNMFNFALPAAETVEKLVSKVTLDDLAKKMDWHAPVTRLLRTSEDAEAAAASLRFPAVLKPPVKSSAWTPFTNQKCIRVNTPAEFLTTYNTARHTAETLVIQEWVPGKEYWTANCYYDRNHDLRINYVSQKLRQWPIETGTGCSGVARRNPEVAAFIADMFRDAGFHGQAYIEVKRDPRDGRYILIEPNIGRSTGRSVMAEADGIEMLLTQYQDLTGQPMQTYLHQPEPGVKWVYWRRELRVLCALWRRDDITIGNWWRSIRGRRIAAVFDWRDLKPFVLHWLEGVGKLLPRPKKNSEATSATSDARRSSPNGIADGAIRQS
ncbi:MAG: hypothetical protein AB8G99_25150 [Planctomycetaceae bacterium]